MNFRIVQITTKTQENRQKQRVFGTYKLTKYPVIFKPGFNNTIKELFF